MMLIFKIMLFLYVASFAAAGIYIAIVLIIDSIKNKKDLKDPCKVYYCGLLANSNHKSDAMRCRNPKSANCEGCYILNAYRAYADTKREESKNAEN